MARNKFVDAVKKLCAGIVCTLFLSSTTALGAPLSENNLAIMDTGSGNLLHIVATDQTKYDPMGTNVLSVKIFGDENGGLGSEWPEPVLFSSFSGPGQIRQTGENNTISLSISGTGNYISAAQSGLENQLFGTITGQGNAAAVSQVGHGHTVSFSQNGTRNSLAISQSAW